MKIRKHDDGKRHANPIYLPSSMTARGLFDPFDQTSQRSSRILAGLEVEVFVEIILHQAASSLSDLKAAIFSISRSGLPYLDQAITIGFF